MVTYADLRDLDPYVFREGESAWFDLNTDLGGRATDTRRAMDPLADWTGAAGDGARANFTAHADRFQAAADTFLRAYGLFHDAADRFAAAKQLIAPGVREVEDWGLSVAADGTITDDNARNRYADEALRVKDVIRTHQRDFHDAVAAATRADTELAGKLRRLSAETVGLAPPDDITTRAASATIPPRGTAPADVKTWWDSLTPMEQESLLFNRAADLATLDGVPVVARDRANRFLLDEQKAELLADKERLEAKDRTYEEDQRLAQVNAQLGGLQDIADRLNDDTKTQAYLLAIDYEGTGRAIIAAGNPDTATNVATYVPGTDSNLAGIKADMNRSDRMLDSATRAGSESTAVITWLGYDVPQGLLEAASAGYAEDAKHGLDQFQDGLRATHEGAPSHNTVVGHSYGSTVIGHTATSEGLDADALVFVGSPGVGVNNVAELNFPADEVYATVAENDIIHLSNMEDPEDIHEMDPAGPDFGAHVFASAPGTEGPFYTGWYSSEAHSQYWDQGNPSLIGMGTIIAGGRP